jgi:hypothetical protein
MAPGGCADWKRWPGSDDWRIAGIVNFLSFFFYFIL